jgi:diketogulonate reductase-like aldo/keto reductase
MAATALRLSSSVTLNNGVAMPRLGLGVWKCSGKEAAQAVSWALEAGYRHIDTARVYGNEAEVGRAVRESGIPRAEIFVTTKLWTDDHGYDSALKAFDQSLARLGLDYVDLYLSHFPVTGRRLDAWRALEKIASQGKCRAVGVSNYTVDHLKELLGSSSLVPAANQVEFHPFLYQKELLGFCRERRIQLEAYSPLTHGKRLGHPGVVSVAKRLERTPAQVLIRWALQHDLVVIPKSSRRERIVENGSVFDFELSAADMAELDGLDENLRTCWDPTGTP